jgi:hypothetical protein
MVHKIDLALSGEEKKDFSTPRLPKAPEYPHGLKIRLGPDELKKLGIEKPLQVDTKVEVIASGFVKEVAKEDEQPDIQGQGFEVCIQLTELSLHHDKKENTTKAFYGE